MQWSSYYSKRALQQEVGAASGKASQRDLMPGLSSEDEDLMRELVQEEKGSTSTHASLYVSFTNKNNTH